MVATSIITILVLFSTVFINTYTMHTYTHNTHQSHQFSDTDKMVFKGDNDSIESPYPTSLVHSINNTYIAIEKDALHILYNNACKRIALKKYANLFSLDTATQHHYKEFVLASETGINLGCQSIFSVTESIYNATTCTIGDIVHNKVAIIREDSLMLLLQWSYGIKKNIDSAEIILNIDETQKSFIAPLFLFKVIEKYSEQNNVVHADTKNILFNPTEVRFFTESNGRIAAPYNNTLVLSTKDIPVVIEQHAFNELYYNILKRYATKPMVTCNDFLSDDSYMYPKAIACLDNVVHADTKNILFNPTEVRFFTENNGRIAAPYNNTLVLSTKDIPVVIEQNAFNELYYNILKRYATKRMVTCNDFLSDDSYMYPKAIACLDDVISIFPRYVYHATLAAYDIAMNSTSNIIANNTLIILPENILMFLLQWSYGIARNNNSTEILLNADGTKKFIVEPWLLHFIHKYHKQENVCTIPKEGHTLLY